VSYYNSGGYEDITAYLRQYPLAKFDPYAAPKKTEAFWAIANAHQPNEVAPLIDALDQLGNPLAVTIEHVKSVAGESSQITKWLTDPKNSRAIPYRFEACGYIPHRNPDAKKTGGLWTIQGKQQVVYVQKELEGTARNNAVEALRHETTGVTQARMRDGVARREAEAAAMSLERAERAAKEDGGKVLTFRPPSAWAPGPDPIQEVDFS